MTASQPFGNINHPKDSMKTDIPSDDDFDWPPYEFPEGQSPAPQTHAAQNTLGVAQGPTTTPTPLPPPEPEPTPPPLVATPLVAMPNLDRPAAFPAFMSRSALFGAFRPGHAGSHDGALKAAGSYGLHFQGERLSMFDKRVWEAVARCAKSEQVNAAEPFDVILSALAKDAGVAGQSGPALARVRESLRRLAMARILIEIGGNSREGALLSRAEKIGHSTRLQFDVALAVAALGGDIQFELRRDRRNALNTPFAQWLHDFLSTHEPSPQPLTLGYLRELCGYVGKPRRFSSTARTALAELAAKCPELVAGWSIDDSRRSGEHWRLTIVRGAERPLAVFPAAMKNKWPASTAAAKRRGGVAL